jgi:hypothetical protein
MESLLVCSLSRRPLSILDLDLRNLHDLRDLRDLRDLYHQHPPYHLSGSDKESVP